MFEELQRQKNKKMRIWSLHPQYLDTKGLVALWRETLLAKHVLEGKTKGYRMHPQLLRFKHSSRMLDAVNFYLQMVFEEASKRGYSFGKEKFTEIANPPKIPVTSGQMAYEAAHLLKKLETRDFQKYRSVSSLAQFEAHPLFTIIDGEDRKSVV